MSTQQIAKFLKGSYSPLGRESKTLSPIGKLYDNQSSLVRESNLSKVEEALCGQDKIKKAHLKALLLRSEIVQKRLILQISTKKSLYEKTKPNHSFSVS